MQPIIHLKIAQEILWENYTLECSYGMRLALTLILQVWSRITMKLTQITNRCTEANKILKPDKFSNRFTISFNTAVSNLIDW